MHVLPATAIPSRRALAQLVALAGLAASVSAQPIAQPVAQPLARQFGQPANQAAGQSLRKVFVDEAVGAREALSRVEELIAAENWGEAVRVLSGTLRDENEQLLAKAGDPSLYIPVRDVVHGMLLRDPALLDRYRLENEPAAAEQLAAGEFRRVERERLLTISGFEAALRLAQTEMESARFWSAWRVLAQLETHPDMQGVRAAEAISLGTFVASYLQDATVTQTLAAWRTKHNLPADVIAPAQPPAAALALGRSPLDPFAAPAWNQVAAKPLQSWTFSTPADDAEEETSASRLRALARQNFGQPRQRSQATPWIFPSVVDGVAYVNDSIGIAAFDAATLSLLWRTIPPGTFGRNTLNQWAFGITNSPLLEDVAGIAANRGIILAVTGQPANSLRNNDPRLHALDAKTGQVKWSLDVQSLDDRFEGASIRGLPVIEGDVAVIGVRRPGLLRRVTTLYLVGIDLYSGRMRWAHAVGSVGTQPWSARGNNRADTSTLHQGIVYRGDELSVLGAYDAGLGRPLWVRVTTPIPELDANQPMLATRTSAPYQITQPLVIANDAGPRVYFLEPTEQRDVIELDARTGALISSRTGAELGTPEYITQVGQHIAFVGNFGLSFVNARDFASGKLATTGTIEQVGFAGRATALGSRLAIPVVEGLITIDPEKPADFERVSLDHTGNLTLAASQGNVATLLTADALALHSYLPWETARTVLTARMDAQPADPLPVLAFIELAFTQNEPALVPDLADRALRAIAKDPSAQSSARDRLFRILAKQLAAARVAAQTNSPAELANPGAANVIKPLTDLALLSQLEKRLALAAESTGERVTALFERSWLQDAQQKPSASIEALQEILADDSLATVDMTRLELPGMGSDRTTAGDVATSQLATLLTKTGPAPYALFDEEAQRALAALPAQPTYAQLARIARQYPFAASAPLAWQRAGDAATKAGNFADARAALGKGLQAAIANTSIGRDGQTQLLGDLLSSLIAANTAANAEDSSSTAAIQPLQRLLLSLAARTPSLRVRMNDRDMSAGEAATELARTAPARRLPAMASTFEPSAQLIEGWEPLTPLEIASNPAVPAGDLAFDAVVMISRDERRLALFATSAIDGTLARVWERDIDIRPTVVRVGLQHTVLLWPRPGDARLAAISNLDGSDAWTGQSFNEMPAFAQGDADDRPANMGTPLDGVVRGDDIIITTDGARAVMTERRGRCAIVDLATGKLQWAGTTGLSTVFDTEFTTTSIVFVGAAPDPETKRNVALISCIDIASGQPRWKAQGKPLGDHARWARALPGDDLLVGTSGGVLRLRGVDGSVAWQCPAPDVRSSLSSWLLKDRAIVLNGDFDLFAITLDTGVASAQHIDVRDRLMLPFSSAVINNTLVLSSSLGLVTINDKGQLAGVDALDSDARLEPALFAGDHAVIIETGEREPLAEDGNVLASRVLLLANSDARIIRQQPVLLFDSPTSLHILDNRVLVGQGPFTIVYRTK